MLAAAAVAVLGLQAPVSMTRVTQSRVRMAASEEPWNADCFSSTLVDKTKLECAALRRARPRIPWSAHAHRLKRRSGRPTCRGDCCVTRRGGVRERRRRAFSNER